MPKYHFSELTFIESSYTCEEGLADSEKGEKDQVAD